jgi:hypothetical protein
VWLQGQCANVQGIYFTCAEGAHPHNRAIVAVSLGAVFTNCSVATELLSDAGTKKSAWRRITYPQSLTGPFAGRYQHSGLQHMCIPELRRCSRGGKVLETNQYTVGWRARIVPTSVSGLVRCFQTGKTQHRQQQRQRWYNAVERTAWSRTSHDMSIVEVNASGTSARAPVPLKILRNNILLV